MLLFLCQAMKCVSSFFPSCTSWSWCETLQAVATFEAEENSPSWWLWSSYSWLQLTACKSMKQPQLCIWLSLLSYWSFVPCRLSFDPIRAISWHPLWLTPVQGLVLWEHRIFPWHLFDSPAALATKPKLLNLSEYCLHSRLYSVSGTFLVAPPDHPLRPA